MESNVMVEINHRTGETCIDVEVCRGIWTSETINSVMPEDIKKQIASMLDAEGLNREYFCTVRRTV